MSRTRTPASIQGTTWGLAALALLVPAAGHAWIYSEHRDIAGAGIARLSSGEKQTLDRLWAAARKTMPARLCEQVSAGD